MHATSTQGISSELLIERMSNLLTTMQAVLLSSRNSEQASAYLLDAIGCTMVLYSTERTRQADALTAADHSLEAWRVPDLWDVFGGEPDDEFSQIPTPGSDPEERVAVYIHSSGTTGQSSNLTVWHGN